MNPGPRANPEYLANSFWLPGRADLWGGYSGGNWFTFNPGGYGFNAAGEYNIGPGYGVLNGGSMWGNPEAAWARWALSQSNAEEVINFLIALANGIKDDGVYAFSGAAVSTLYGVWQNLAEGEGLLWRMNRAGNAMEFLQPQGTQLLASAGNYLPSSGDGLKVYARMTGVGYA